MRILYNYFKYQVMFFNFFNVLVIFKSYINKILTEKFNIFVIVYLDDILIYIKNLAQPYVKVIRWVLNQFRKHFLFANLKKYWFYQDKVFFLRYIVLSKKKFESWKNQDCKQLTWMQVNLRYLSFSKLW